MGRNAAKVPSCPWLFEREKRGAIFQICKSVQSLGRVQAPLLSPVQACRLIVPLHEQKFMFLFLCCPWKSTMGGSGGCFDVIETENNIFAMDLLRFAGLVFTRKGFPHFCAINALFPWK